MAHVEPLQEMQPGDLVRGRARARVRARARAGVRGTSSGRCASCRRVRSRERRSFVWVVTARTAAIRARMVGAASTAAALARVGLG